MPKNMRFLVDEKYKNSDRENRKRDLENKLIRMIKRSEEIKKSASFSRGDKGK